MPGRSISYRLIEYRYIPLLLLLIGTALIFLTLSTSASFDRQTAEQGQQIFQQNCASCHTVGKGKLVGPDLQGVTALRDRQWLQEFILDPTAKFDSGDPIAMQLLADYSNIRMPNMGLTAADVEAILIFLESSSAATQPAPTTGVSQSTPAAPAVVGNAAAGQRNFTGETSLANGGTACIACHSISGSGVLDGGTLGPDLTQVLTRYGEPGLTAAISTVNFPTMIGIFGAKPLTPQEVSDLVAYFTATNTQPVSIATKTGLYLGIAGGLAVILFAVLLIFWPRQRQSISEKLRAGKL
ncbi:MAG: c-type cytochrome [Bellilinea sp.]